MTRRGREIFPAGHEKGHHESVILQGKILHWTKQKKARKIPAKKQPKDEVRLSR